MATILIPSCNSQTDLENLVNDEDISKIIKDFKQIEEVTEPNYGLLSYETKDIQNFKFGNITFSNYSVKDGYDYGSNSINICVENYESKKYLGSILNIVKEDEAKKLLAYLEKKHGNSEKRETGGNGIALFWEVKQSNQWIFLLQDTEHTREHIPYLSTKVIFVKQGVRIENSKDSNVFSILDNFNLAYPKE
jgi:hypothetical protein